MVVNVRLSLVQSDLAIQYNIQAFRLLLFLIHKSFLPKLGKEHRPAYVINRRKVLNPLNGLDIQENPSQRIDVSHSPLLWLTHEYLEHQPQIILLDVIQIESIELDLLHTEDGLKHVSKRVIIEHKNR